MLVPIITVLLVLGFALGLSWIELLLRRKRAEREERRESEQRIRERMAAIGEEQHPPPEGRGTPP